MLALSIGRAPKLSGETVFISDPYGDYHGSLLAPHAKQITRLPCPPTPTPTLIAGVQAADHVISQKCTP